MTAPLRSTDRPALEARLASYLVGGLNAGAEALPADIAERLRHGREAALERVRQARHAAAARTAPVGASASGTLLLGRFLPWLQRASSVLPLALLLGGLLLIQQWSTREQVLAAAEIDTLLLADSLPPSAYSDPGFAEFLRSAPRP